MSKLPLIGNSVNTGHGVMAIARVDAEGTVAPTYTYSKGPGMPPRGHPCRCRGRVQVHARHCRWSWMKIGVEDELSADSSGVSQLGYPGEQVVGVGTASLVSSISSTLSLTLSYRTTMSVVADGVDVVGPASSDAGALMAPMDASSWRSSLDVAGASSWRSAAANAAVHSV